MWSFVDVRSRPYDLGGPDDVLFIAEKP